MSDFIDIDDSLREAYNRSVNHPVQSFEWGEFRKENGLKVIRRARMHNNELTDAFTATIHAIPKLPFTIGYVPKASLPSEAVVTELRRIGKEHNCIFIQLEPNITIDQNHDVLTQLLKSGTLKPSAHPLFYKYTFILNLEQTEDELLAHMHPKTRYNIRVAQRHGVAVYEDNSDHAFREYMTLTEETTQRQKFYAHNRSYHTQQWHTLPHTNVPPYHQLSSHLLVASLNKQILTTWILFIFKDTLYYPYGASSNEYRNTMHSNLMMWEAIKFGKDHGLRYFDMWGALQFNPDPKDPWYGFHRFKQGYGPEHTEYVGSYDLIINPLLYPLYSTANKLRWLLLTIKK